MARVDIPLLSSVKEQLINPAIVLLFALALIYFLWGVWDYLRDPDNPSARQTGSEHMIWGIVGMAIMTAVYGILGLIAGTIAGL